MATINEDVFEILENQARLTFDEMGIDHTPENYVKHFTDARKYLEEIRYADVDQVNAALEIFDTLIAKYQTPVTV